MAGQLAGAGHEVHLVTYGQGSQYEAAGVCHHRIRRLPGDDAMRSGPTFVKPLLDLLMAARLCRVIRRHRIDVVHAHNYEAALVALLARLVTGPAVIYHSHNLMNDELPQYFKGRFTKWLAGIAGRLLDCQVPRRADQVIALCHWSAARLLACGVEPQRLSVVPPALVDPGRAAVEAPGEVIGYCGNLDPYQNLGLLLEAFALLRRTHPQARLLIIAHRPDEKFAVRIEAEAGVELRLAGSFEEASAAMTSCRILVLPRREGSGVPIKLVNYLALGRPVVAAGCGAKLLAHGSEALLVADDDAGAMAVAVAGLLEDRARAGRIGACGRLRYERNLTWAAVLPELVRVYDAARAGRSGKAPTRTAKLGREPAGLGASDR